MEKEANAWTWEGKWWLATWLVPPLLLVLFAHQAVLPMAARLHVAESQLESLRENTYDSAWLDSTQLSLRKDVETLQAFHDSRLAALTRDGNIQATIDRIRALAQKSGIEVVKTTPVLGRAEPLRLLKIRVEGFAHYPGLLAFFESLQSNHPDLFLEELLIRQGGEQSGGRLETHLVLHAYTNEKIETQTAAKEGGS